MRFCRLLLDSAHDMMIAWAEGVYASTANPHEEIVLNARARGHIEALTEWATKIEDINAVHEPEVSTNQQEEQSDGNYAVED